MKRLFVLIFFILLGWFLPVCSEEVSEEEVIKEIEENDYLIDQDSTISRSVYDNILIKSPYDKFSEMTLTHNYIYIGSPLEAIKELDKLKPDTKTQILKAQAFYNMEMFENAYEILDELPQTVSVVDFKNKINQKRGYNLSMGYLFYYQKLNEEFKLDSNKVAFTNSCYHKNMQIYLDYIMQIYTSGRLAGFNNEELENFTNEIRLGTIGRLNKNVALRTDLGVKVFQGRGAMILTNSWVKYFLNDDINFSMGFSRNNVEQTFLSAVGLMLDNKFTGQIANNHWYVDSTVRFKNKAYLFMQGGAGIKEGKNIDSNIYWDATLGLGKIVRYKLDSPFLQKISIDAISYHSGYQRNLENIYDSNGNLYGGYFSPMWYSDNTLNVYFSGGLKKAKLNYGFGAFGGWQFAEKQHQSFFIWGASIYSKYKMNDHLSAELQYRYYKYANVTRNQFIFDIVITLFRREKPT